MDLIYSVRRKYTTNAPKTLQNYDCLHEGNTLCSVSSQNIVAFSTKTELEDVSGKTWGSHVYVADLNTPWHSHKVVSSRAGITALEWDLPGDKLLVADTAGNVQIWSFKDHVLNDWVCLGTASFQGEHILGAAFFHNGKKINVVAEKKDNFYYNEKFSHLRFAPSVRHFGGRPIEGCLVISTTGMVGVVVAPQEGQGTPQLSTTSDSLGSTRHRIMAVDICYGKNGHFLVAVSSGSVSLPIQCYRVSVKQSEDKCVIMSQALPSFFLQSNPASDNLYRHVAQLKFVVREDADSLVVAANGDNGFLVEIWELREKPLPIHKLFQPKSHAAEPFKTVLWQHQSHFHSTSNVVCLTTSKVPPPCYVMVALADGTIHCLYRDSLKPVASTSLNLSSRQDEPPSSKQQKLSVRISHMDMSWLGCILLAADTLGQLYLYRLLPLAEPGVCSTTIVEHASLQNISEFKFVNLEKAVDVESWSEWSPLPLRLPPRLPLSAVLRPASPALEEYLLDITLRGMRSPTVLEHAVPDKVSELEVIKTGQILDFSDLAVDNCVPPPLRWPVTDVLQPAPPALKKLVTITTSQDVVEELPVAWAAIRRPILKNKATTTCTASNSCQIEVTDSVQFNSQLAAMQKQEENKRLKLLEDQKAEVAARLQMIKEQSDGQRTETAARMEMIKEDRERKRNLYKMEVKERELELENKKLKNEKRKLEIQLLKRSLSTNS